MITMVAMVAMITMVCFCSHQLAEEVLKSSPPPGEEEEKASPGFEGMEALAKAIEQGNILYSLIFWDAFERPSLSPCVKCYPGWRSQ